MIDEKTFDEVCKKAGFIHLVVTRVPTWVEKQRMEGIELVLGQIKTFWIKEGVRVYGEPAGLQVQKVYEQLHVIKNNGEQKGKDVQKDKEKEKGEQKEAKEYDLSGLISLIQTCLNADSAKMYVVLELKPKKPE